MCDSNPTLVPAEIRAVVAVTDIVSPISSWVHFRLGESVAQVGEPISDILEVPIVESRLRHSFEVMNGASSPGDDDFAVLLVPGAAVLVPDGTFHEFVTVLGEVLDSLELGHEAVDVLGLPAINHFQCIISLRLCTNNSSGLIIFEETMKLT